MDAYYQPVFNAQLQKGLVQVSYTSVAVSDDLEGQALQTVFANKAQINFLHLQNEN